MRSFMLVTAIFAALVPIGPATGRQIAPVGGAVRYAVVTVGRPAGELVVRTQPNGELDATFEFNDRGRGPKLASHVVVGAGSIPTRIETTGNDYLKNAVDERFASDAGRATWSNTAEHGESPISAGARAFYVSLNALPIESGLLARALLAAPGQRLALLPAGEARIRRVGELEISNGAAKRTVVQYAIEGLGFTPDAIWLDTDGTYFGNVSAWSSIIRDGWDGAIPALVKAQDVAAASRIGDLATSLRHVPAKGIAFTGARVFDAVSGTTNSSMTVVVEGNRITAVGPDGSVTVPAGVDLVDARGKTLLPGMWDMHVHLGDVDGLLNIAAGVTSTRDMGNDYASLSDLRRRFDTGTAVGPRVLMAGLVDGSGPFTAPTGVLVDTPEQARETVARLKSEGYVQLKIYSSIKPELVPILTAEAHRLGMRVSGHIPAFMTADRAVRDGYDEIQHANMLFLNFLFDTVKDTRTPARFTAVAEHAAEIDLASDRVKTFVSLLQEHHTVIDPTVNVFETMFTDRAGSIGEDYRAVADRLPPQVRRGFLGGGLPVPDGMDARYRASFDRMLQLVALLYRSGIRIVPGTDALAGFAYHRELELYVKAGIPAPAVLQLATIGAARIMGRDAELGSIEVGKLADLVLVDGDPATTIGDVRRTVTVVKDGAVYRSADVYGALGVRP